ncbi:MAG TPA: amidohydrolase [Ruminococcaceae bacterium]|nr:amidohydrolase [Oscillospiraceae bacterium]
MLFCNIGLVDEIFDYKENMYVGIQGDRIEYIGKEKPAKDYGEEYDGSRKVLMPGLVNAHTHSPMTLLRGYAENLPLDRWLNERVFPFEDRLNCDRAYYGTMLSIAEQLKSGTTSSSDMYFFQDGVLQAVKDAKAKTNFSRSLVSFGDDDFYHNDRVKEALEAVEKYHLTENGRIKVDMCLHAEYTNTLKFIEQFGEYTKDKGLINHIHLSETKSEHENCKQKYGKTPARVFYDAGAMDAQTLFAHCVWIEPSDIELFKEKGASVAHCPASNLKLGSGVCDTYALLQSGINVAIGTDSAASNNSLDMLREMYLAAILPKGINNKADIITPKQILKMATRNGALTQGREDCGLVKEGFKADVIVLDLNKPNMYPDFDVINNIVYSANSSDVLLTMVDGEVLYRNGEFKYIDVEKVGYECNRIVGEVVKEVTK